LGFYVYITRRDKPFEPGDAIALDEWLAAVTTDATFQIPEAQPSGRIRSHESIWTAHPEVAETWFTWVDGQIEIKSPDEPLIAKAMTLALRLKARVIAESGEIYNEDGSHKGFVDGGPW
jgi:hypothetical protein